MVGVGAARGHSANRGARDFTVRLATPADVPELVALIEGFGAIAPAGFPQLDRASIERDLGDLLDSGAILLLEKQDLTGSGESRILGAVGLVAWRYPGSLERVMIDRFTYIAPAGRGLAAFRRLLAAARAVARASGLPLVLGETSGASGGRLGALYAREGGRFVGAAYRWG